MQAEIAERQKEEADREQNKLQKVEKRREEIG